MPAMCQYVTKQVDCTIKWHTKFNNMAAPHGQGLALATARSPELFLLLVGCRAREPQSNHSTDINGVVTFKKKETFRHYCSGRIPKTRIT